MISKAFHSGMLKVVIFFAKFYLYTDVNGLGVCFLKGRWEGSLCVLSVYTFYNRLFYILKESL